MENKQSVSPAAARMEAVMRMMKMKSTFSDPQKLESYLKQQAVKNEAPCRIPPLVRPSVPCLTETDSGMQTALLGNTGKVRRIIFYLHGGAFVSQPMILHWRLLQEIAALPGMLAAMPMYPLAPVHAFPESFAKIRQEYLRLAGIYPEAEMVLAGDSAGAGLCLSLLQQLKEERGRMPGRMILISPWLDLTMSNPEIPALEGSDPVLAAEGLRRIGTIWAGDRNPADCLLSPISMDLHDLPRSLLFAGTHEIFCPDILQFADRLKKADAPHELLVGEGMDHVYPLYPIPEGKDARARILQMLQED